MSPDVLVDGLGSIAFLSVVKTAILVVGGYVTVTAYRTFRRTDDPGLLYLSIGFGCITAGTFLAGAVYHFGFTLAQGILIESLLVFIGFVVIGYSLYSRP